METIFLKIKLFIIAVACISLVSCLKEEELKTPFITFEPPDLQDGWEISTPTHESIEEAELKNIYQYVHSSSDLWQIRSLLVFRNNKLVAESYTKDEEDRTSPAAIWSCTKQVMGILTGIALESKLIDGIQDPIQKYLPGPVSQHPDKGSITIDNLLKMQSGIAFSNDGINGESSRLLRQIPDNSLDFILGLPLEHAQGEVFNYNDGDPHIISAIFQQQTGMTTKMWGDAVLFSKLNIKNYDWIRYKDGITMGAFGILITPRELAKIGQVVLNGGTWNKEAIVSSGWITEMTSVKVTETGLEEHFGYYWWIDSVRNIVYMHGHGGQFVFIKPEKQLMILTTAEPNTQGRHQFSLSNGLDIFDRIDRIAY